VSKQVALAVLYGFALGLAVGVVLESAGALAALDEAAGRLFRPRLEVVDGEASEG
jgi:hypothetical protein